MERHATSQQSKPDRFDPTRLSIVLYNHKCLDQKDVHAEDSVTRDEKLYKKIEDCANPQTSDLPSQISQLDLERDEGGERILKNADTPVSEYIQGTDVDTSKNEQPELTNEIVKYSPKITPKIKTTKESKLTSELVKNHNNESDSGKESGIVSCKNQVDM